MKVTTKAYVKSVMNLALATLGLFIFIKIVPKLISFFMPFAIAGIIAAIASPMVRFLEKRWNIKWKLGTAFVVAFTIVAIVLTIYFLGSFLTGQVKGLLEDLPEMWKMFQIEIDHISHNLKGITKGMPDDVQIILNNMLQETEVLLAEFLTGSRVPSMEWLGTMVEGLPNVFVAVVMGFLASYFFVAEQESLYNFYEDYIPTGVQKYCNMIKESLTGAVSGYFKAQIKIEGWIYLILVAGLWLINVKYAPLFALGIGLVDLLPIFGAGAVLCPWALFALIGNDYKCAMGLLLIWLVTLAVRQIIQPKIVGDTIGLPSIPTLLLLYAGYKLAGVFGMILAVPIGIILWNLYQAGVFDTITNSFRILCAGFNQFRHLTAEDIQIAYSKDSDGKDNRR